MRIAHFDEMFHPEFGYQINLLAKYQSKQGHEVIIFTTENIENHPAFKGLGKYDIQSSDKEFSDKYNVKIIRLPMYRVISGRVIYKPGYINKILKFKPDILMCHTNDTIAGMHIAFQYNKIKKPIVFDNHMLEMASKNPLRSAFRMFFRIFITPKIIRNDWLVIRTQDDPYVEKCLGIPLKQCPFVSFGADTLLFYRDKGVRELFRKENKIKLDDFVIIYTGKLDEAKGGKLLAETFLEKFFTEKNVVIVIVGNTLGEYGKEVESIFNRSKNRIIRFPIQKYTDLPKFYQMADLCVFAKQCSLSFYDAQACGLPVLSEDNNINVDRCSHNNGWNFKAGDVNDFRKHIENIVCMSDEKYQEISNMSYKYVSENYNYEDIAREYEKILLNEYNKINR